MKKNVVLLGAVALFASLFLCSLAGALTFNAGSNSLKVKVDSTLSFTHGNPLCLNLLVQNNGSQSQTTDSIKLVVINPVTGAVVDGPKTVGFAQSIVSGGSTTASACTDSISSTYVNQALATIVMVIGPVTSSAGTAETVMGSAGWGFTVK